MIVFLQVNISYFRIPIYTCTQNSCTFNQKWVLYFSIRFRVNVFLRDEIGCVNKSKKLWSTNSGYFFFISNGLSRRHCHFEQHQFVAPLIILLLERNQRKLFDRMISCTDLSFKPAIDRKVQLHLSRLFDKSKFMVQLFYTLQNKYPQCGRQNDRISKCNPTLLLCKCACANVHRYYSL